MKIKHGIKALLLMAILLALTGCSASSIKLTEYYNIEIMGVEGRGRARAELDFEKLSKDIAQKGGFDLEKKEDKETVDYYISRIKSDLSPQKDLKNGDKIKLVVEFAKDNKDKVSLKGGEKTVEVKDLGDGEELNIFDYVDVSFEGSSPRVKAVVENRGKDRFFESLKFQITPAEGLKLGDKVKVKAIYDEAIALENNYFVQVSEKTFVVERVDRYILEPEVLNGDALQMGSNSAQHVIDQYAEKEKQQLFELTGGKNFEQMTDYSYFAKPYKIAFLTIKDPSKITDYSVANILVYFFEIEVKSSQHSKSGYAYGAVFFNNVVQLWSDSILIPTTMGEIGALDSSQSKLEEEVLGTAKEQYDIMLMEF